MVQEHLHVTRAGQPENEFITRRQLAQILAEFSKSLHNELSKVTQVVLASSITIQKLQTELEGLKNGREKELDQRCDQTARRIEKEAGCEERPEDSSQEISCGEE